MKARGLGLAAGNGDRFVEPFFDLVEGLMAPFPASSVLP
jgi:hypothetical protein